DNGWYLFADALYWHADVGDADWGVKFSNETSTGQNGVMHHLDFKWSWGFKAGIGVNMDHDMWDTNFYYTWFRTENSNAMGVNDTLPNVTTFLPPVTTNVSTKLHWSIQFSMFDWELGRWFYVSKSLSLRPHVGVKGGWINQERKVDSSLLSDEIVSTGASRFANDFWGVGPSAGLNTMWVLGSAGANMDHRFSFFGDFAGALMYGHFHDTYSVAEVTSNVTSNVKITNLDRNLAVPMLQTAFGLSWDTSFNRARNHFMMKVGYELQYWFRQNQFLSHNTTFATDTLRCSADLALQGVTAELRFDF
ncbi:MAG: Lpg1974 family pore-forming outer membrane protein, partial [Rhabdochlamydiaceae bacterium]